MPSDTRENVRYAIRLLEKGYDLPQLARLMDTDVSTLQMAMLSEDPDLAGLLGVREAQSQEKSPHS
jgi:hypothetical protein